MKVNFYRVRSVSDIIISVTLIISGIVLMFIPTGIGITILGLFMFLIGSLFLYLFKSVYKKEGSKEIYRKRELKFRRESLLNIQEALLSDPNKIDMSREGEGWTVKLNVYFSRSAGKGYLQLFEYIPYNYEPCTRLLEYSTDQIGNLINRK